MIVNAHPQWNRTRLRTQLTDVERRLVSSGPARIGVIGAGYVGLTTAACLSHLGHSVKCADPAQTRIARLREGELPLFEKGLGELVLEGLQSGRLTFTDDNSVAASDSELVFLCVPTPQGETGEADTTFIEAAASSITQSLQPGAIVITKSTVPVGSTRVIEAVLGRSDVKIVSNPEFLREGSAVHDFLYPARIVIGADNHDTAMKVARLYEGLSGTVIITDPASAETIKYASNAFLATKASFANAIAALCEAVSANVIDVIKGIGLDPRIGAEFLTPGPGWGGSCLPKDTQALVKLAADAGYDFSLLRGVIAVNDEQCNRVVAKVERMLKGQLNRRVVGLLGLTFKAGTDDVRGSPAVRIACDLAEKGALISAFDPAIDLENPPTTCAGIQIQGDMYAAATGAEVLVIATEWDEFRTINIPKLREIMAYPAIVDARNLLEPTMLREAGFTYEGIGIP